MLYLGFAAVTNADSITTLLSTLLIFGTDTVFGERFHCNNSLW